ncbi:HAMP domain-containing protein [Desulforamulus putei]|uniref:histidine kinase n=1 Tax=Desulforamulus putei DSM 12395 TaxID=1121429 RepID=A0A1M4X2F8_9FIRM|nr:HAMP domain-containing protein [Desulforamulus putei]SHE87665.1 HAMP domain-containing protein [Desulforamulus putei DSM 12395]
MFKRKKNSISPQRIGRFSLGFKLSLGITLLIMFLMICVGINSYLRNRAIMLEEAQNRGWITARTVSAFAADYLRGNNTALLGNIMDHLERDPFVKRVAILDLSGTVVMASDKSLINQKLESNEIKSAMVQNKDTLNYRTDIKGRPLAMEFTSPIAPRNESPIGYFWMEADLRYISAHLLSTAYNQLYTSLLAILAGLIISRLIILRVVQRPVKELVKATDRVSTGDFSGEVRVFNRDELGRLATAFNTMTGHLSVLFQSIRSSVNDINHTAQVIINRSEQSDIATRKILKSLREQSTCSELHQTSPPEITIADPDKLTETTLSQQEHLKEIRNASKKLIRYIDRLNSISLQFKFNEK